MPGLEKDTWVQMRFLKQAAPKSACLFSLAASLEILGEEEFVHIYNNSVKLCALLAEVQGALCLPEK
jgi:hypothetical protein